MNEASHIPHSSALKTNVSPTSKEKTMERMRKKNEEKS
jgi:hypothetical protein